MALVSHLSHFPLSAALQSAGAAQEASDVNLATHLSCFGFPTIVEVPNAVAQTVHVLGYAAAKNVNPKRLVVFKEALAALGYVEARNIRIEYREAVLDAEYQAVIADLIERKVNIIVAANVAAAVAADASALH